MFVVSMGEFVVVWVERRRGRGEMVVGVRSAEGRLTEIMYAGKCNVKMRGTAC